MIQDIYPSRLDNSYSSCTIGEDDTVLVFDSEGMVLLGGNDEKPLFLTGREVEDKEAVYLFSLDERRFFLSMDNKSISKQDFGYYTISDVRDRISGPEVFAIFTGYHLWKWYDQNRYCGRCGKKLKLDDRERALRCPDCGNVIYPRINPAVIVGVIKGDSILITRYRSGYRHNALVAGFAEIGETLEQTVAREVMEEAGIKVKNIRYYKSQPWGMAQDLLAGFFCEADGDGSIHMDEDELKYAQWVRRENIMLQPNSLSLTNEMMMVFKEGKEEAYATRRSER